MFYKEHWQEIEPERLARYEEMFQFRQDQEPILNALSLKADLHVVDFGCGPGFLAAEIAKRLPHGSVTALDLNQEFIQRATQRASADGVANIHYQHVTEDTLPLADASADRVLCKNVLEYVPDVQSVLAEHHRVLKPDGQILVIDSDWGFVLVEPWGKQRTDKFFEAAAQAFNEPLIGRQVPGALRAAGFDDVKVTISAGADLTGRGIGVLKNMASYVRTFETLPEPEVASMLTELEAGIEHGTYLFVLPQFTITARRP